MSTQSCPGILQLATALAAAEGVEAVAYAKMGRAMHATSGGMNTLARDEYQKGLDAISLAQALTYVQWASTAIGIVTLGMGAALSVIGGAAASSAAVTAVSSGVSGASQATQAALGATQSVMQAVESQINAGTQADSTALETFEKIAGNDANTIKEESQGAGKVGSAINTVVQNEGSVAKQRFI
jgi:hypothetical protein